MIILVPVQPLLSPFYEFVYEEFSGYVVYSLRQSAIQAHFYIDKMIKYQNIEVMCNKIYKNCSDNIFCFSVSEKNFIFVKFFIGIIKKYNRSAVVICIGEFSSFFAKKILDTTFADYVLHGNPFHSIIQLYYYIIQKNNTAALDAIPGLTYRKHSKIFCNNHKDCNYTYFETVSLIASNIIPISEIPRTGISFTRGCNQKCTYCQYSKLRDKIVKKNPELVRKELWLLQNSSITNPIEIRDENIAISKSYLDTIIPYFQGKCNFYFSAEMRIEDYTDTIISKLKSTNIKYLGVGIEAFDKRIINVIKKLPRNVQWKLVFTNYLKTIKRNASHFSFGINIILGLPCENLFTLIKNAYYINKYPFDLIVINKLHLFQGTELFDTYPPDHVAVMQHDGYCEKYIKFDAFRYKLFFYLIQRKLRSTHFNIDFFETRATTKLLYLALIKKENIACSTLKLIYTHGKITELIYSYNEEVVRTFLVKTYKCNRCFYIKSMWGIHYHVLDIIIFKNKKKLMIRTQFSIVILSKELPFIAVSITIENPYIFICNESFIEYHNLTQLVYKNITLGLKHFSIDLNGNMEAVQ